MPKEPLFVEGVGELHRILFPSTGTLEVLAEVLGVMGLKLLIGVDVTLAEKREL